MSFLFVDRILQTVPGETIKGLKYIRPDDQYLTRDRAGRSCFIPSLIGETLGQLTAWNVMKQSAFKYRPVAGVVQQARLFRPAYAGETLLLESYIDELDEKAVQYHSLARVGEEEIFSIEGALGPLLPMSDFIQEEEVRRQYAAIEALGDWPPFSTLSSVSLTSELEQEKRTRVRMCFDRILSSVPNQSLSAELSVNKTAPYFPDHFPLKPVLPLTVLLECQLDLAQQFIADGSFSTSYRVTELSKIKMNEFVIPGDLLVCHVQVKKQSEEALILNCRSEVAGKRVCIADLTLIPDEALG